MGVVGILVAMVINMFVQSSALGLAISIIGVLLFAGLTAYDTQKIKSIYFVVRGTDFMGKAVVMGALNLYLDFVNMFTRSEEHTSELQSLMRISYAVFCLKKKKIIINNTSCYSKRIKTRN